MNAKIVQRMRLRAQLFSKQFENLFFREAIPLNASYCTFPQVVPFAERLKSPYQPIHIGEAYGKEWEHAWFHITGNLPEAWQNRPIALRLNLGGEILVVDNDGIPVEGLTHTSVHFPNYLKEYLVLPVPHSNSLDLWCEAFAMPLVGQCCGCGTGTCSHLEAGRFDEELWNLKFDVQTVLSLSEIDESARSLRALMTLDEAISCFGDEPENAAAARSILQQILSRHADDGEWTAWSVGHAHIDVGWLWPVHESRGKAIRTFASQLRNMERYPDYVFGASQPQLYAFVKELAPELYVEIQHRVHEGRWELQGGMWVEADCNLISGESMVRQFLHGKNFFRDEFGIEVKNLWLPDVFGYSAALPQIMRGAGCDAFLTQKISWNEINTFPYHAFRWRGIDGTEVVTHFPPDNSYNSSLYPARLSSARDRFNESATVSEFMVLFGMGDGGGGPKEDYIERGMRCKNLAGVPKVKFGRAEDFFKRLQTQARHLPVWSGELYLEKHRGTYTTQGRTKRNNRQCEQWMAQVEMLWCCLQLNQYPAEKLDQMWKSLLCKQFHDILPGSSIAEVYRITEQEHADLLADCRSLVQEAASALCVPENDCITIFNSLSYSYTSPVELPAEWGNSEIADESGTQYPLQNENGRIYILGNFPPLSFTTLKRKAGSDSPVALPKDNNLVLENTLVRYEFNPDGVLISAYDKTMKKEVIASNGGNLLTCYRDKALCFDAWDVDNFYRDMPSTPTTCISAVKMYSGPVREILEFQMKVGKRSSLKQQVILAAGSKRLDFVTEADWHEDHQMLRVSFALNLQAEDAVCDIQYGYIRRPTHTNTSWEAARFEVCAQRYVDLSTADGGAALLNDCKYGYHLEKDVLDLALLRSPRTPSSTGGSEDQAGELTDQGEHTFTYSFLPHEKTLAESNVIAESACLNRSVLVLQGKVGKQLPVRLLPCSGVSLEVIKKAEKEDCLVIRLVETAGRCSSAVLTTQATALVEVDLLEWNEKKSYPISNGKLELSFKPFEIRTFKVK